mgnify:CR=1 FL=1
MGSIRDYMKVTVATPLLVLGEVLCEMLIPFITANLIDAIKDGATVAEMLPTAGFLVLIALTSLAFGAAAGVTCSHASCGFAKNLRHDLFYKIQTFSFANIDEFSSSSLVTRLTTDINNVQQAFMMIIRIAVRAAAGIDLRLYHGVYHGRQRRHGLPGHHSAAGLWTVLYHL